jgi:hypothetical protein
VRAQPEVSGSVGDEGQTMTVNQRQPRPQIETGQRWKRPDDTLDWKVVSYDEAADRVLLAGPGNRRSGMYVGRVELLMQWVRA